MTPRTRLLVAALSTIVLILFTIPAVAQDFRGAVSGTVTDSTGGVLPGVTITVTNTGTNGSSSTVTDAKGFYEIRHLISGTYSVEAKLDGFRTEVKKGMAVHVGDVLRTNFSLQPGGVSEVISVTAKVSAQSVPASENRG